MRVLILGAGGVGGYLGGRLIQSGVSVTFLVRAQKAEQLAGHGLRLTSQFGDWEGKVNAITAEDRPEAAFDLVVLACKGYDLAPAIHAIRPFVRARTQVLPLLNGMGHMERLQAAFPGAVLGGLAHIMVSVAADGTIVHGNRLHRYRMGALPGGDDGMLRELVAALQQAPIEAGIAENILDEMWSKFQFISGFAAVTTLLQASVGKIVETDAGGDIMREALAETARVAEAEGFPVTPEHMASERRCCVWHGRVSKSTTVPESGEQGHVFVTRPFTQYGLNRLNPDILGGLDNIYGTKTRNRTLRDACPDSWDGAWSFGPCTGSSTPAGFGAARRVIRYRSV